MKSLSKSTADVAKPEFGFAYLGGSMQGGSVGVDQKMKTRNGRTNGGMKYGI